MEDLTPAERLNLRLRRLRGVDDDPPAEASDASDASDPAPAPPDTSAIRARLDERLSALRENKATLQTSIEEVQQQPLRFDSPMEGIEPFDPADVDEQTTAAEMRLTKRRLDLRRQEADELRDPAGDGAPETFMDTPPPGDAPATADAGDEGDDEPTDDEPTDDEPTEEQSILARALSGAVDTALAMQPGTEENARMLMAIQRGFQRSLEQLRGSASAFRLTRDPDSAPAFNPLAADASFIAQRNVPDTEEERQAEAQRMAEAFQRLEDLGQSEAVRRAGQAPGFFSAVKEVAKDPAVAVPELVASSSLQSAPSTVGAMLGSVATPVGMFVGQFLGTLSTEEQAATSNLLAESGVDISDPVEIMAATADPAMRRDIRTRAMRRGMAVGTVDGLFGAATAGLSKFGLSPVTQAVAGFALESVGEGAGELAGQVAAGEEISGAEAALEIVAAMGQSGVTSAAQVAADQMTPSERRLQQTIRRKIAQGKITVEGPESSGAVIRRKIDEGEIAVEVPESQIAQMMKRAVELGGLESPERAADRVIQQMIANGQITIEGPQQSTDRAAPLPTPAEAEPLADQLPEAEEDLAGTGDERLGLEDLGIEGVAPGTEPTESERAEGQPIEGQPTEDEPTEGDAEPTEGDAEPVPLGEQLPEATEDLTGTGGDRIPLQQLGIEPQPVDLQPGETISRREPVTVEQRLDQLGLDVVPYDFSADDVAQLENLAAQMEDLSTEELEQQREQFSAFNRALPRARVTLIEQELDQRELARKEAEEEEGGTELDQETINNAATQAAFSLFRAQSSLESDPAAARAEFEAFEELMDQLEEDYGADLRAELEPDIESRAQADIEALRSELRRQEEEEQPEAEPEQQPEAEQQPEQEEPESEQEQQSEQEEQPEAEPEQEEQQEQQEQPEQEQQPNQQTETEPSTFDTADTDDQGRVVPGDEWQIAPEGAVIPADAQVRYDLGTSGLPVVRRAPTESESEAEQAPIQQDLSKMGRRTPIQQEERIEQQLDQTRTELEQAQQALRDLKAQRPEQSRQQSESTGSLFPDEQPDMFAGTDQPDRGQPDRDQPEREQPSLDDDFEPSQETTSALQRMIDQQEAVVDQLQQRLIDLRKQAPDRKSQARRSQQGMFDEDDAPQADRPGPSPTPAPTSTAPTQPVNALPNRTAADMRQFFEEDLGAPESRQKRQQAIAGDLFSVVRDQWARQPGTRSVIEQVAATIDRVRELRTAEQRGYVSPRGVEADIARMKDTIDRELQRITPSLATQEAEALQDLAREWVQASGIPPKPSVAHLKAVTGNTARFIPTYESNDGYTVQATDDGGIEVVSPNTGNAIDGRSSNYADVLVEYFAENTEAIDEAPRVTDDDMELGFGEWSEAVAANSQNPFEIIEAVIVEQQNAVFDPVGFRLKQVGRMDTSSLEPYISRKQLIERGAGNWIKNADNTDDFVPSIEQVARDINQDFGLNVTPQEIVDEYILQYPGGPSTVGGRLIVDDLMDQFQSVTGIKLNVRLADRIYRASYESKTDQQRDEDGGPPSGAVFEARPFYRSRPVQQRGRPYVVTEGPLRPRQQAESLAELIEDYPLRETDTGNSPALARAAMEQMDLFGPDNGQLPGDRPPAQPEPEPEADVEPRQALPDEDAEPVAPGTQSEIFGPPVRPARPDEQEGTPEAEPEPEPADPFALPITTIEAGRQRQRKRVNKALSVLTPDQHARFQENVLGRAISDVIAERHSVTLIGKRITSPDDLAALAQTYRDPRFETFRIFFVRDLPDGTEQILFQTGVTQRLPGSSTAYFLEAQEYSKETGTRFAEAMQGWVSHTMGTLQADGFYVMHNHPSGSTDLSKPDKRLTRGLIYRSPDTFRGHVVIDSGEYTVLGDDRARNKRERDRFERLRRNSNDISNPDAAAQRGSYRLNLNQRRVRITDEETLRRARIDPLMDTDELLTPSVQHRALGKPVKNYDDLVAAGQVLQEDADAPILVLTNVRGYVRGVVKINLDSAFMTGSIKELQEELLAYARHTGSTDAFLVNVGDDALKTAIMMTRRSMITDFVTQAYRTGSAYKDAQPGKSHRIFGFRDRNLTIRAMESRPDDEYRATGRDIRDEVRRRVGRLNHERPPQQDPAPNSGPAPGEKITQAAVRIGDDLYTGMTHAHAVQAALDEGALTEDETGEIVYQGTPIGAAEDVNLDLFVTNKNNVVSRQTAAETRGVARADQIERTEEQQRRGFEPVPDIRAISRSMLNRATVEEQKEVDASDVPAEVNSVENSLQANPESQATQDIHTAINDETINSDNPVSAPDVIRSFIEVVRTAGFEVPYRYGHYRGFSFGTLGVFKVEPEVIRLKEANDIPVAAHEMGHALEKAVFGWVDGSPWQMAVAGTNGAVQDELVELGKDLYGDRTPNAGYKREGWAEFITYYLLTDTAQERAPLLYDWFENTFLAEHPAVAEKLRRARDMGHAWYEQGALSRAEASVQKKRSFWTDFKAAVTSSEGRRRLMTRLSQATLTEFSPLLRIVEEAESRLGGQLPLEVNPFLTAEALAKTHTARARMMVEQGTFDFAGNPVGAPLRDAAAIVKGQRDEFTLYLWARRALKLWEGRDAKWDENGRLVQTEKAPRNPGLSKDDAKYIFDYYDSIDFRRAAEMVYTWNDEVLDYTKAAWDSQLAEQIKGGDVGDYIPLQRVFDDLNESAVAARKASRTKGQQGVLGSDPVKALKGSNRRIRDPFQTMIEQAEELIRATHEKYLINQLVQLRNIEGMGRFIERVPRDMVPQRIDAQRVVSDLQKRGLIIDIPREEVDQRVNVLIKKRELGEGAVKANREELYDEAYEELWAEKVGSVMTFFKPAIVPETGDPIVAIQNEETGKIEWYELSRELYDSFQGLDIYRLPWYMDLLFGIPARTFRLGTTGIRASFALITNPLRDIQVLYAQSRSSQNPASMFYGYLQSMGEGLRYALTDDIDQSDLFARFMRLGGEIARPLGVDTQETRRAVRELFQGRAVRMLNPRNYIDHLRDIFQIPETTTRVAEMRAMAEEVGYTPGTRMSDGMALMMLLDAKRVTTDFTSQGQITKQLNQTIPFVTAAIGGTRAFARAFKQNPARAITAGTTLTAATLAYWWELKDEEWYKDLTAREKFNNWIIPLGDDGPVLVLPRPFEWGTLFSAIPEALADAWYQDDPEQVEEVMGHMFANLNPLSIPTLANPIAEQLANEQFYFNRPIVPMGEERKPAAEQFGPYTSTVAIQVGRALDVSPRRIDHLIAGYFGGVGRDVVQAMDALLSVTGIEGASPQVDREQTASDIPVAGRLFRPGGKAGTNSRAVDEFYERLEEHQLIQASDIRTETFEERQTRLMLGDAQKALSLMYWLRRSTESADQREALMVEIRRVARDALQTADAGIEAVFEKRRDLSGLGELDRYKSDLPLDDVRRMAEEDIDALELQAPETP